MSKDIPTCRIHEKHVVIKCANPYWPRDLEGLCLLHSQDKTKDLATFRADLLAIWNRKDLEYHDFSGVFFPGLFDPTDFFGSREFNKPTYFYWAIFTERANFYQCTFNEIYFSGATFMKEADFFEATFTELSNFSAAKIGGQLVFRNINPQKEDEPRPPPFFGDFRYLEFQDQGLLRFQDMSLSLVRFAGTNLRRLEFFHVQWNYYRGRQAIYDEILLRQGEKENPWFWEWFINYAPYENIPAEWGNKYGEVERLYRNLKINYETKGDYKNAGDFHYGEMEMHRRSSKWRWFPFYWYNFYWYLSGYGERPSWAMVWLAVFLAAFTGLLALAGMEILDPKYSAGFGNSFFYLLQKVTLQRPTWAEPRGFWGKLVAGLSVLFIPGQAALFIFALRNRLVGRRR